MEIDIGSSAALRAALALSCATGKGFEARLRLALGENEQAVVRVFADLWAGRWELGDTIRFEPGSPRGGRHRFELPPSEPVVPLVSTASVALGVRGEAAELVFTGSTHASDGATFEVAATSFTALSTRIGLRIGLTLQRAGFPPHGGGQMTAIVQETVTPLSPLDLDRKGELEAIRILSGAPAALPAHVQQRQAARARSGTAVAGVDSSVQLVKLPGPKSGSVVAITGVFGGIPITVSAVSRRGGSVESVGEEAASEFRRLFSQPFVLPPVLVEPILLALAFSPASSRISTWRLHPDSLELLEMMRSFTGRDLTLEGGAGKPARITLAVADRGALPSY
ncbi:MAG TPA: RNA 3'-terminal phosphate cyclase [Vicinamibacteria bacterium]|nr:RNA 3'-terminal phosphate cyclase [Vicinamibacteria bacterium]